MTNLLERFRKKISLPRELKSQYQEEGFAVVRNLLTPEEVSYFSERVLKLIGRPDVPRRDDRVFLQIVNAWRQDEVLRGLTLHSRLTRIASHLAGVPLRLWHDQILVKKSQDSVPTEFHQDQPYWPHLGVLHSITAWIALGDVPVERGSMSFIPGTHRWKELPEQDLTKATSLFAICPEMKWMPRVTVPLRKGDCTLHHGRCAHMAGANRTGEMRIGYAVIFIDASTRFSGARHQVTDPLGLAAGDLIEGPLFPRIGGNGLPASLQLPPAGRSPALPARP